ncbi:MAG TPA: TerC family protein [Patescibacteria group bacterium]|nr:TerC family protein [Patescibacteria group bacterium]
MDGVINVLLPIVQIALLDIVLSGDNVGVIALAIRNIDPKKAKLVSMIGITGAILIRIFFASILTVIMDVEWLPIKLAGGILLLKITWDLINEDVEEEGSHVKSEGSFWKAVVSIILADISMGLDNVLAIAGAAHGSASLIALGVMINIPIIFFGSQFVADLMKKHKITIYIGGAILMHTALSMILEDRLLLPYVSHLIAVILSWLLAAAVLGYGFYKVKQIKIPEVDIDIES